MPPIDPVSFVLSFCKDVASNPGRKRAHAVKRLTPMTLIGKATENGIDELAKKVLDPHFNLEGVDGRKVGGGQPNRILDLHAPYQIIFFPLLWWYRAWMLGEAELQGGHQNARRPKADTISFQFAVRPNLRNNTILSRNSIIRQVAAKVGPKHKVDLKNYDLLILVEVYKVGLSVVITYYISHALLRISRMLEAHVMTSLISSCRISAG